MWGFLPEPSAPPKPPQHFLVARVPPNSTVNPNPIFSSRKKKLSTQITGAPPFSHLVREGGSFDLERGSRSTLPWFVAFLALLQTGPLPIGFPRRILLRDTRLFLLIPPN